jgi:hypothetical protein
MINAGELSEDAAWTMQKLPEVFICSGERDALCIRALGYRPLWFNSETYRLTPPEYAEMTKYAERIYNLPDIDATGIRKAVELSMQYYDIHVVWLPERLKEFRDRRGRPRKDFRDFCEIWPEKIRFQELLNMAMPFRFWEYRAGEKGGRRLEFITEYAIQFIQYNGFVWIDDKSSPDGKRFVHIQNNTVRDASMFEIRHFFREYVRSHHLGLEVRELVNNTSRFNDSLLEKVDKMEVDFCRHTPNSQLFFFRNAIWEATPEEIVNYLPGKAKQYVWENEIIGHNVRRLNPAFETERKEDGTFDIKVSAAHGSKFFHYLINSSRIYWREELEAGAMPEEELKAYRETYRFAIDGPALSNEKIAEQKQHLVNKIFALGYLLHNYKTEHRALCVYAMDNRESSVEESNGGTGKSFCFKTPRMFQESVTLSGRNPKLTENDHLFENVTTNTRYVLIDDSHQYTNFDFFFDKVTGDVDVNQKHVKSFTVPFHLAPKFCITSNYVLRNIDASTARRILYAVFSDYYHQKTDTNGYLETRTIYDDFGKDLFRESYTEEEWNADINFLAECCRFYLSTLKDNVIIQPPMNRVRIRNLRAVMGETFLDWAEVYFSPESGNCDRLLPYSDVILEYKTQTGQHKLSTILFTQKLRAYCDYDQTILAYNPTLLRNGTGRIIRKKDGKATAFLYVQRKSTIYESSEYAATTEDVPEEKMPF